MKRNRIFSIGALVVLALVLSACRITVDSLVDNQQVVTSWEIPATGEYVVCENQDTWYEFRFNGPNSVAYADVTITGDNRIEGEIVRYSTEVLRSDMTPGAGRDYTFDVRLRSDRNPYPMADQFELEPSAIIIRPVPPEAVPAEGGGQTVTAIIRDGNGIRLGSITDHFDVWGGCN